MAGLESMALVSHTPLVRRARARRWSCLHAALLKMTRPPSEAIAAQRVFPEDPLPGLRWLIGALPAVEGVQAYVQTPDADLCALVVQRTKAEPASLVRLDPSEAPWRALWSAHVMAGGAPWPPDVDKAALCQSLLQALQTAEEPPGVVPKIAEELAPHVFRSTARAAPWARLSAESTRALVLRVVTLLNEALERGEVLARLSLSCSRSCWCDGVSGPPNPEVLIRMLQWGLLTDEAQVCQWISRWQTSSLVRHANTLGEQALSRRWVTLAELLYRRSYGDKQIGQAALLCVDSFLQAGHLLRWAGNVGWSAQDDEQLIQRVADLGAELRQIGWTRSGEAAGGKTKQLSGQRDRSSAWREAARFAHHGKLDGGLYALSRALLGEFPRNDALRELIDLLAKKHHRDKS
ncbi:MAG: hypothetical protein IPG17_30435 [Sandaracinaceae bacterium]|nr:hypothetical protein [Sandaracinaceae bacterium]